MNAFHISAPGIDKSVREASKKMITLSVLLFILITAFLTVFELPDEFSHSSIISIEFFLVVSTVFSILISTRKIKRQMRSFQLTIDGEAITREIDNMPSITITREKIREIVRFPNGSYVIRGERTLDSIGIPAYAENPELLERLLTGFHTVTVKSKYPLSHKLAPLFILVTGGGLLYMFIPENEDIRLVSLIIMSLLLLGSFVLIQTSKNFDKRMKRFSYMVFIPLLSIIAGILHGFYK